ncbi:TolC family protein [Azospirillum baldaniorum]|uniref:TolC family protein n=1 Tax=Azospirillum baldaniorum TaxID=1064539 RepID=UPI002467CC5F|nr:TolC family protein [Azospirillum baldaniorum]
MIMPPPAAWAGGSGYSGSGQGEHPTDAAQADLEARTQAVAQARNALQLLIGVEPPTDLPLERQAVTLHSPAGLSSDLLLRRPSILQAEQALIAANADIGAARAAFFPRLSLTTSLGYVSPAMAGLFGADHGAWTFAPQITLPLFQGGRLNSEAFGRTSQVRHRRRVRVRHPDRVSQGRRWSDGTGDFPSPN